MRSLATASLMRNVFNKRDQRRTSTRDQLYGANPVATTSPGRLTRISLDMLIPLNQVPGH